MKIAVVIVSYNMPDHVDKWVEYLEHTVEWPIEIILVDNGSRGDLEIKYHPNHHNIILSHNLRTTGGVMTGVQLAYQMGCTHVWTISTSTLPPTQNWTYDPVARLANVFVAEHIVACSPTFVGESTSWPHQLMMSNGFSNVENHWLIGMFAMWEINCLMEWVDLRLSWSWGVDMELSALARVTDHSMYKHNGVPIQLHESVGYEIGRMTCSKLDREKYAREEMNRVMTEKYGDQWKEKMVPIKEYRDMM